MYVLPLAEAQELAFSLLEACKIIKESDLGQVCIERMGSTFVSTDETETIDTAFLVLE